MIVISRPIVFFVRHFQVLHFHRPRLCSRPRVTGIHTRAALSYEINGLLGFVPRAELYTHPHIREDIAWSLFFPYFT